MMMLSKTNYLQNKKKKWQAISSTTATSSSIVVPAEIPRILAQQTTSSINQNKPYNQQAVVKYDPNNQIIILKDEIDEEYSPRFQQENKNLNKIGQQSVDNSLRMSHIKVDQIKVNDNDEDQYQDQADQTPPRFLMNDIIPFKLNEQQPPRMKYTELKNQTGTSISLTTTNNLPQSNISNKTPPNHQLKHNQILQNLKKSQNLNSDNLQNDLEATITFQNNRIQANQNVTTLLRNTTSTLNEVQFNIDGYEQSINTNSIISNQNQDNIINSIVKRNNTSQQRQRYQNHIQRGMSIDNTINQVNSIEDQNYEYQIPSQSNLIVEINGNQSYSDQLKSGGFKMTQNISKQNAQNAEIHEQNQYSQKVKNRSSRGQSPHNLSALQTANQFSTAKISNIPSKSPIQQKRLSQQHNSNNFTQTQTILSKTGTRQMSDAIAMIEGQLQSQQFMFQRKKESVSSTNKKSPGITYITNGTGINGYHNAQNAKTKQNFYTNINLLSQNQTNSVFNAKKNYSRTSSLNNQNASQKSEKVYQHANHTAESNKVGTPITQKTSVYQEQLSTNMTPNKYVKPNQKYPPQNLQFFNYQEGGDNLKTTVSASKQVPHHHSAFNQSQLRSLTGMNSESQLQTQTQNNTQISSIMDPNLRKSDLDNSILKMMNAIQNNNHLNLNQSQLENSSNQQNQQLHHHQVNRKIAKSDIYKIYVQGDVKNFREQDCYGLNRNATKQNGAVGNLNYLGGAGGFESYRVSGSQMLKSMKNKMKQQMLKKHLTQVINHNQKSLRSNHHDQSQSDVYEQTHQTLNADSIQQKLKFRDSSRNRAKIEQKIVSKEKNLNSTMVLQTDPIIESKINTKNDSLYQNSAAIDKSVNISQYNYQTQPDQLDDIQIPLPHKQNVLDNVQVQLQSIYLGEKSNIIKSTKRLSGKTSKKNRSEHISIHQESTNIAKGSLNQISNQNLNKNIRKAQQKSQNHYQQDILAEDKPKNELQKTQGYQQIIALLEQKKYVQNLLDINLQDFYNMSDFDLLNLRQKIQIYHAKSSPFQMTSTQAKFNQKLTIEQEKLLKEYQQFFKRLGINLTNLPQQEIKNTELLNEYNQKYIKTPHLSKKNENIFNATAKIKSTSPFKLIQPELIMSHQISSSTLQKINMNPYNKHENIKQKSQVEAQPEPKIQIINKPFTHLKNHPINITIRLLNSFLNHTLVKSNSPQLKNIVFDQNQITSLAKQIEIELPKNQFLNAQLFKSKNFIIHCKEMILRKLFQCINQQNQIELNFERSQFQFYKGFVGKGNNAQLIIQLFKNNRWWWSLYQNLQYTTEGEVILPVNCKDISQCNINLYKEDFKEHNFIWTQWKKHRHFSYLKPIQSQSKTQLIVQQTSQKINPLSQDQLNQKQNNMSNDLRVYAKLENNFHLSNKCALFYNMKRYYEAIGRDPFEVIPLTYHIKKGTEDSEYFKFQEYYRKIEDEIINQVITNRTAESQRKIRGGHNQEEKEDHKLNFSQFKRKRNKRKLESNEPSPKLISPRESKDLKSECNTPKLKSVNEIQQLNSNYNIASQRYKSIDKQQESFTKLPAINSIHAIQTTSQINNKFSTQILKTISQKEQDKISSSPQMKNIWIVKPGENTNRGNGITVCQKLSEIKAILNSQAYDHQRTFIVQKYMENPSLYKNRKFDIRCYGMLTSINGHQKGFFYEDGYIRTSSREYSLKKIGNKLIHLTNDAVQKKADDYGKYEAGNKVSFKEYQQYLNETCPELNIDFMRDIFLSQIKRIITDTFRATYNSIDPKQRNHTFEIFGYDFMLDHDFRVNLIEVNTNPCIETTCPILSKVITDMVDSGLRIALDPLFPPPNYKKRVNIQQIPITHWELVYDSNIDFTEMNVIFENYERKLRNDQNDVSGSINPVKDLEQALIIEEDQEDDFY